MGAKANGPQTGKIELYQKGEAYTGYAGPAEKSRRVEPDDILMTVDGHAVYGLDLAQISEKYQLCLTRVDRLFSS